MSSPAKKTKDIKSPKPLHEAFATWTKSKDNKIYFRLTKDMSKEGQQLIKDALEEIYDGRPSVFNDWWCKHHMRYIKTVSGREQRHCAELLFQFLSIYARGELQHAAAEK